MRKLIALIFASVALFGCEPFVAFDYYLPIKYDAVYCYVPEKGMPCKKDTTIHFSVNEMALLLLRDYSDGQKYGHLDLGMGDVDALFREWGCDTVSFFIFDRKVVDNNSWDDVVKNYMVLQRYDFSKDDLVRLRCQIYYLPTKEMSEIRMFPRYVQTVGQ